MTADEATDPAGDCPCVGPSRRAVLAAGGGAAALLGLAGCARYSDPSGEPAGQPSPSADGPAGSVATTEVPVGGGTVMAAQGVVITQPTAGRFAAFVTRCPHQGCSVNAVEDGTINCPCHGSRFRIADGGVARGPARTGLAPRRVRVAGDRVIVE